MDCLSLVSDESIQNFSDRLGVVGGVPNQRINISHLSNRIYEIKNSWLKALVPESLWIRHYSDSTKSLNSTEQSLKGKGQVQKSIETGYAFRINHEDICRNFRFHNVFLQTDIFLDLKNSLLPSMQIS